ncbi:MAG: (2Fe-2S)-binding protein [Oleiphilaceae bacterium]|nr:(2Fe-2S)-binding protein [Oleiphilaceae bacterium]
MLVCVCQGIRCRDIDAAMQDGAVSVKDLRQKLNLGTCCGQCVAYTKELMSEKLLERNSANAFHLAQEVAV